MLNRVSAFMKKLKKPGKIFWKYRGYLLAPILLSLIYSIFSIALPILLDHFIDSMAKNINTTNRNPLIVLASVYFCIALFWILSNFCKTYFGNLSAWKITDELRIEMIRSNIAMGHMFYNHYSAADVLEHMENDIETIEVFIIDTLIPMLTSIFTILGIFVYFFLTQFIMGICFLLLTVIIFLFIYRVQQQSESCIEAERTQSTRLTAFLGEVFALRKEIYIMNGKKGIRQKSDDIMLHIKEKKIKKQQYLYRIWTFTLAGAAIANTISLLVSGKLFFDGLITIGTVYIAYSFSTMLREPLEHMQYHMQNYKTAKVSYERYNKMMRFDDGVTQGLMQFPVDFSKLTINNVSYSYSDYHADPQSSSAQSPDESQCFALHDVSLIIDNGEKLGVFGASGAGKSTLCKLICKLYALQTGDILFDTISVRDISTKSLRENVAYITASDQVFCATLKDNLDMFAGYDIQEIIVTIENYGLRPFLNISADADLPAALTEMISGDQMSHGQRQLISLSRLFFRRKKLIIFDEAAANVDESIENEFFSLLEKATKGHMSIIVTHNTERLGTCQRVIEFFEGGVRTL